MSRLDDEWIFGVVRNRSGIDSGEIDYCLMVERFERMSIGCLKDSLKTMEALKQKVLDRIEELDEGSK